jgi:transketolase
MKTKTKKTDIAQLAIDTIRFLAVDAVEKANSGHPGTPMALAPIAYTLWTQVMKYNPKNPAWANRDRFVLSAGHASMLQYAMLHLAGYDVSLDDLRNFRQWESKTPGHPEYGYTPGVETTTGPLGQGISTAVGMAMGQKYLNQLLSPKGKPFFDYSIYGIASDGDIMEGVASEASSLAGHLGLGRLIFFYDDNRITIDGSTDISLTENVGKRYEAYGWHVQKLKDGNDLKAIEAAIKAAQKDPRPSLIITRTHIGFGSPNKQDTSEAHGAPLGAEEVKLTKQNMGWPLEPTFRVPPEVYAHFAPLVARGEALEKKWNERETSPLWKRLSEGKLPDGWEKAIPEYTKEDKVATRKTSGEVINALAKVLPELIGGSADLAASNNTNIKDGGLFTKESAGRNIAFGVREHAMSAILNGLTLSNALIPFGGTFFIFTDYMKGGMRIAGLLKKRVIYVLTHDSIGLGEDGPTHQPIEQLAHLRAMPNMTTLRPADANETAAAWKFAIEHTTGPVSLVLTRQNLPVLTKAKYPSAGQVEKGAYVLSDAASGEPDIILIATGSEVALALQAQEKLQKDGLETRVVSMPSWELFDKQPPSYRESVLPPSVRARVAIEALSTMGWERYVGLEGRVIGMTSFGSSAPANVAFDRFGFNVQHVVQTAQELVVRK